MEKSVKSLPETRQTWIAPKLKKVDVESITAGGASTPSGDGSGFS